MSDIEANRLTASSLFALGKISVYYDEVSGYSSIAPPTPRR